MDKKYIYIIDWLPNLDNEEDSMGDVAYTEEYMQNEEALDRFFGDDVELRDRVLGGEGIITYGNEGEMSENVDNLNSSNRN